MVCCAVAYHRLNSWQASAAAPVEWVARGLSPIIGFAVGILVLMTALTSNIGNITLIGSTVTCGAGRRCTGCMFCRRLRGVITTSSRPRRRTN